MKLQKLVLLLILAGVTPLCAQESLADRARNALSELKSQFKKHGRSAYDYTKQSIQEGIRLMQLAESFLNEAQSGLKKLDNNRDEFIALGQKAQAQFDKLMDALTSVEQEAIKLYQEGAEIIKKESNNS